MVDADEHTLEDLELLASACRRRRAGEMLRWVQGVAATEGAQEWKRWQQEMIGELKR